MQQVDKKICMDCYIISGYGYCKPRLCRYCREKKAEKIEK